MPVQLLSKTHFGVVCEWRGVLVGVAAGRVEKSGWILNTTKSVYVMTLGVSPPFRRYKIASKLMALLTQWFVDNHECNSVYLHVLASNDSAVQFYQSLGLTIVNLKQNYYHFNDQYHNAFVASAKLPIPDKEIYFPHTKIDMNESVEEGTSVGASSRFSLWQLFSC